MSVDSPSASKAASVGANTVSDASGSFNVPTRFAAVAAATSVSKSSFDDAISAMVISDGVRSGGSKTASMT